MSIECNIDSIKQSLTCNICQDIVTLPVHSKCCEASQNMSPACMSCVRNYCDLNKPINQRIIYRKSWNGCGCDIYCKNPTYLIYSQNFKNLNFIEIFLAEFFLSIKRTFLCSNHCYN